MSTQIRAIIRKSYTVTGTGIPDARLRKPLTADGFTFRTGPWVKHAAGSRVVDRENVAVAVAACRTAAYPAGVRPARRRRSAMRTGGRG